jgi:hypothetical protein
MFGLRYRGDWPYEDAVKRVCPEPGKGKTMVKGRSGDSSRLH